MKVNKITKKLRLSKYDIIKYQIMTECIFFKKENIIPSDIEILTLLSMWGDMELGKFCNAAAKHLYVIKEPEEFSIRSQNVRNRVSKLISRSFIIKSGDNKKTIVINPEFGINVTGDILLDYNFIALETSKA